MTSREYIALQDGIRSDVRSQLDGYSAFLHTRYNPPIAAQAEPKEAETTPIPDANEHTTNLLREAYDKQTQKHKREHKKRLETKPRERAPSTAPESASHQTPRKRQSSVTFGPP